MRVLPLSLAVLGTCAGLSALLAQTVEGLDLQAIKAGSAAMQADAQAFADHVKDRGDQFREEASQVREGGVSNMARIATADLPKGPNGAVDFDEIVKGANANANGTLKGEAPQFIVFASLSIPPQSLRALISDTARAGGVVVFRGFPNNSMRQFAGELGKIIQKQDDFANVGVDPRLFRAFNVTAVPTYVAVSSDFDLCAGFHCETKLPPHDRMTGNVTVQYALESFRDGRGAGAGVASVALANIERNRP